MPELPKRVLTALVGIPLFLLALVGPPASVLPVGSTWLVLVMLIALVGSAEMISALERHDPHLRVNRLLAMLAVYLPFEAWLGAQQPASLLPTARLTALVAVLAALAWEVWQAERRQRFYTWRNVGVAALLVLYLGVLLSTWVHLRLLNSECARPEGLFSDGVRLVLLGCVSVWACDSVAYFVGNRLGRRRLAPRLSPRKSWEGAGAGVLAGVAVAMVCAQWLEIPALSALVLGGAAAVVGQVGDLFESALKRELGVKDFGELLPGHGGVMDRLDSLLFALPVVYLLSRLLPICP